MPDYVTQDEFKAHLSERDRVLDRIESMAEKVNAIENRLIVLETTLLNDYNHKLNTWRFITLIASVAATLMGALLSKFL